jgi:long-chain acyl-CoA synthetase
LSGLQFLKDRFASAGGDTTALVWQDRGFTYGWLLDAIERWQARLVEEGVGSRDIVSLTAEFSPNATALLLALAEHGCTIVPLTGSVAAKRDEFLEIAQVTIDITMQPDDSGRLTRFERTPAHPLYESLWQSDRPGLILFSSGSTGKSKAVVHDFQNILEKFKEPRPAKRTLAFLLFDHIGGINTLFHVLSNGGTVVTVADRSPAAVCRAIETYRVEILPTSPTFLNLLMISGALDQFDLGSLHTITYGTEVMPESTLLRLGVRFPDVVLLQTYGLSEVGILRSRSESSGSLWVRIGGNGFDTRVVDGMLQIRSSSTMLGYLNAPSPITADGWFMTGDAVEERDGFVRIFGRKSELINVGGEKVFPAEIESVLHDMDGVADVFVYGEPHAIVGNMVVAKISLATDETIPQFRKRMVQHCRQYLAPFKVPQKIVLSQDKLHGGRFKKIRSVS